MSSEEKLHGVKYIIESFVGCISDMVLSSGKAASDLLPIVPLIATKHENVKEGCIDRCRTVENLCFVGSRCINEYNGYRCDCFGTLYEEHLCDVFSKYDFDLWSFDLLPGIMFNSNLTYLGIVTSYDEISSLLTVTSNVFLLMAYFKVCTIILIRRPSQSHSSLLKSCLWKLFKTLWTLPTV